MKTLYLITLSLISVLSAAAQNISSCGAIISNPGNYNLTADLTCASSDAIVIKASNVSLKLNGHIVTGPGASTTFYGISLSTQRGGLSTLVLGGPTTYSLNHVVVQGPGLVRNFAIGFFSENCAYCQISQVTAAGNFYGIDVSSNNFLTLGANVLGNNTHGMLLSQTTNSTLQYNDVSGNGDGIVLQQGGSNTLNNNVADAGAASGIFAVGETGTRLYSNVTNGNVSSGIEVDSSSTGNQIFNNSSSAGNGATDLADDHNTCNSTLWANNFFQTSNLACIH